MKVKAMAAIAPNGPLSFFEYKAAPLKEDEVQIKITHCGICHSDLSMLNNDWGRSAYPFVPGHEIIGIVSQLGKNITHLSLGQTVGIGWYARSCMHCQSCHSGAQHLCSNSEQTIVKRHGGFASHIQVQGDWVFPLNDEIDPAKAGPLFCGGITVFNPLVQCAVSPLAKVGVIGIGGLGHLALQFYNKWGCEVTAFSSSSNKHAELKQLGGHHVVSSTDPNAWKALNKKFDFLISTVNHPLNWPELINTLAPKGRLHFVGAVLDPLTINVVSLIGAQRTISASPTGGMADLSNMLNFSARHKIHPITESFPLSKANEALDHLRSGKARYRIVLKYDLD